MMLSTGRITAAEFDDLFKEIFARYPEAETFDPCPCGLTLAVVRPEHVQSWHFPVPDLDLRRRTSERIIDLKLGFANYQGDDGVLIIAEIA